MELAKVISEFGISVHKKVSRIGSGHINETYLVQNKDGQKRILQKINNQVFRDPEILMSNLKIILDRLHSSDYPYNTFDIISTVSGNQFVSDSSGFWRMISFMDGEEAVVTPGNSEIAEIVAEGYGNFLKYLNELDPPSLVDTIPDFHNPEKRFQQFLKSIDSSDDNRQNKAGALIDHALALSNITVQYSKCCETLPARLMHGDSKASNILINAADRTVKGVIDLDTVMPGHLMNDFGDMVRSMCNTGKEDDKEFENIKLDPVNFQGIASGFLKTTNDILLQEELDSLLIGVKSILYEQFLRFITDYLNGDIYYDIKYSNQNLDRAKVHLKLLLEFQRNEDKFLDILNKCLSQLES